MNIAQIANVSSVSSEFSLDSAQSLQAEDNKTFSQWMVTQAEDLNSMAISSENAVSQIASGDVENLHQIIMGMEKAKMSFELAVQVRDKLLEGYHEILRMQV
ncbi:MAG: flagellar hook-basal body complex protein FliE [Cycloclasticus sp.]|jgi:flagellar hook-basal body complex protein FliE